jgi:hypothetical protein
MPKVISILPATPIGRLIIALTILVALGYWGYCLVRDERVVDGQRVHRRFVWWGRGLGNPIPTGHLSRVYYSYRDDQGKEVRHGETRIYRVNGTLTYIGNYRHGKLHGYGSHWDETGTLIKEGVVR